MSEPTGPLDEPLADVLGQPMAVQTLRRAVRHERLASAYLFEGPAGVGKQLAALSLARHVVAEGDPEVARRIEAGLHPDVRVFPPRDKGAGNLPVEQLREEILPLARFAPFEARATFLVFPEADRSFPVQHPEGANALLKTLEEPRPGVHFLLLSERPDRLLPTIRSRCQRVRFGRLGADVLATILRRAGHDEERIALAVALADGSAARALQLASGLFEELLEQALAIDEACATGGAGSLVEQAEAVARHEHRDALLEVLALYYRDVAAAALGEPPEQLGLSSQREAVARRAGTLPAEHAAERVRALLEAPEALARNASPQLLFEEMFLRWRLHGA